MTYSTHPPVVLCCSGHDPSGGAGIQADIETAASLGCHAAGVITAITAQNTQEFVDFEPVDMTLCIEQMRAVLDDCPVAAVKIGMLGSTAVAEAIYTVLKEHPHIPVVLDPVLTSSSGGSLAEDDMIDVMKSLLLPITTVFTPNAVEARRMACEADNLNACAQALLGKGCDAVLLTGGDEATAEVVNLLFNNKGEMQVYRWPRIQGQFHGTGCTLATAVACLLAQDSDLGSAVREAQQFTWECIRDAFPAGKGQWIPNRLHWTNRYGGVLQ